MKVLFSNPPWWGGSQTLKLENGQEAEFWTSGLRAGSRWPFTTLMRSGPDKFVFGDLGLTRFLWVMPRLMLQKILMLT